MNYDINTRIFLDYAAATPTSDEALKVYLNALRYFANPQALHTEGLQAARVLDEARRTIACALEVKASELVFTSGGTEANNLALAGYLAYIMRQSTSQNSWHIVLSAIEHPSVHEVIAPFIQYGLTVTYVTPTKHGEITAERVQDALQENTVLVSVALVNSEIGTVQPLHAIAKIIQKHNKEVASTTHTVIFHTDASQGTYETLMPHGVSVDMMTFDAGKMYGPRGIGVLYLRQGVSIDPVLRGGSQEEGVRPGTENVALAAGFAEAVKNTVASKEVERARMTTIRETLHTELIARLPDIVVNGTSSRQSPHILNVSIPNIDAEYVMMYIDQRGVACSTKSACLERAGSEESTVVRALCAQDDLWRAKSMLRFSFGHMTKSEDMEYVANLVKEGVEAYREMH